MKLAGISALGDFWRVIREFNPEGIEREATAPLELWLVGEPGSGRRSLAGSLLSGGERADGWGPFTIHDLGDGQALPGGENPDLLVLVVRLDRDLAESGRRVRECLGSRKVPTLLVFTHADAVESTRELRNAAYRAFSFVSYLRTAFVDATDRAQLKARLVPLLVDSIPSLRTSLARSLPAARQLVAEQIISETCRVNAQFALVANIPANFLLLGGVAGSVADFFVLTKNQVMMVFRLAAIHGRDIAPTTRVAAEIAPVIGGAFLWRTAARMLVGMLPTLIAAAPKTAIAYVGTYVVGHSARYYYDVGHKPPRQLLQSFADEGARLYRRMLERGPASTSSGPAA